MNVLSEWISVCFFAWILKYRWKLPFGFWWRNLGGCQPALPGPFLPGNFPITLPQESQVQDVELHHVNHVPLALAIDPACPDRSGSLPVLQQINTPAHLGNICKLNEGALHPLIPILDKERY